MQLLTTGLTEILSLVAPSHAKRCTTELGNYRNLRSRIMELVEITYVSF